MDRVASEDAVLGTRTEGLPGQTNSLFEERWWLDAVVPGSWGEAVVARGGSVVARLPYAIRRRWGLTTLFQPPLTQTLGPWFHPTEGDPGHRLTVEMELMEELIDALPRFDVHHQSLWSGIGSWLPFYWRGYSAMPRYSYRIEDLTDIEAVWSGLRQNIRRAIRKAAARFEIVDDRPLATFAALNGQTFRRQGMAVPYDGPLIERVDAALAEHGGRRVFYAIDSDGVAQAALYLAYDARSAYYLMGGHSDAARGAGAPSLLMWEAIRFAATVTRAFDFEGSMLRGVERHFRSFGGRPTQFLTVRATSRRAAPIVALRDAFGGRRG